MFWHLPTFFNNFFTFGLFFYILPWFSTKFCTLSIWNIPHVFDISAHFSSIFYILGFSLEICTLILANNHSACFRLFSLFFHKILYLLNSLAWNHSACFWHISLFCIKVVLSAFFGIIHTAHILHLPLFFNQIWYPFLSFPFRTFFTLLPIFHQILMLWALFWNLR